MWIMTISNRNGTVGIVNYRINVMLRVATTIIIDHYHLRPPIKSTLLRSIEIFNPIQEAVKQCANKSTYNFRH